MIKPLDLSGKRFGRLVVLERAKNSKFGSTYWLCKCDCGNIKIVRGTHLKQGKIKSCGCISKELGKQQLSKHNLSKTRIYHIYLNMKSRCYNENNIDYKNYGGRGITICEDWKNDFMAFYNWAMNNGYKENLSIDRIDVNGNYEQNNCRWATPREQSNNTRRCIYITHNNETHTVAEWGRILNIKRQTIEGRLKRNETIDRLFYKGNLKYWQIKEGKVKQDNCPLEKV